MKTPEVTFYFYHYVTWLLIFFIFVGVGVEGGVRKKTPKHVAKYWLDI